MLALASSVRLLLLFLEHINGVDSTIFLSWTESLLSVFYSRGHGMQRSDIFKIAQLQSSQTSRPVSLVMLICVQPPSVQRIPSRYPRGSQLEEVQSSGPGCLDCQQGSLPLLWSSSELFDPKVRETVNEIVNIYLIKYFPFYDKDF